MTASAPDIYVSPLLAGRTALDGAAEFQGPHVGDTQGVAWHYGAPLVEQTAIERGPVFVDRSQRRVLSVTGPDAPEFLNNLFSQKLDELATGASTSALDLDMQGHILHQVDFTRTAEGFLLDTTAAQAASLQSFLERMVFWSQVTITATDLAIVSILGPDLDAVLGLEGIEFTLSRRLDRPSRVDLFVPRPSLADAARALAANGFRAAGLMAYTAERVKALAPEKEADLDGSSIPHEVEHWVHGALAENAVHLNKGCYRGQETVARVENLGRSPRALVLLHLDGSAPSLPATGDVITLDGRKVGRIGTIVDDCDYGPIALALIKRSALGPVDVQIGDVSARIDPDSLPREEGPKAGREAQARLRGGLA